MTSFISFRGQRFDFSVKPPVPCACIPRHTDDTPGHNAGSDPFDVGRRGSSFRADRPCPEPGFLGPPEATPGPTVGSIHLKVGAIVRASLANLCTKAANGLGKLAASGHITGCNTANFSAIQI